MEDNSHPCKKKENLIYLIAYHIPIFLIYYDMSVDENAYK